MIKHWNLNHLIWGGALCIALGTSLGAFQLLMFNLVPRNIEGMRATFPLVHIHIFLGLVWIISGLVQFLPWSMKNRKLHRKIGYIYLGSSLISNTLTIGHTLYLQEKSAFGPFNIPHSIHSIVCTVLAIYFILRKDQESHRAWMIRSFIMVLSMPLNRLVAGSSLFFGLPNLHYRYQSLFLFVVAELIVHRKTNFDFCEKRNKSMRVIIKGLFITFWLLCLSITAFFEYLYLNNV